MSTKLSDAVYGCIFPGGMIPLKCKDNLAAIDHRITEIEVLASGRIPEGQGRRIVEKNVSAELTRKIVALRESQMPPLGYSEIMDQLGNQISADAARDRYERYVKKVQQSKANAEGYAAISGQAVQGGIYNTPPEVQDLAKPVKKGPTSEPTVPDINGSCDQPIEPNKLTAATLRNVAEREQIDGGDHFQDITKMVEGDGPQAKADGKVISSETVRTGPERVTAPSTVEASAEKLPTRSPTIRNSRIVEEPAKVDPAQETAQEIQTVGSEKPPKKNAPDLTPAESGKISGPKIPHGEDDFVYTEREAGKKFPEIRKALAERGIQCTDTDVASRFYQVRFDRERGQPDTQAAPSIQPEVQKEPSLAGTDGAPKKDKSEPRILTRHELDKKIWDLWKAGKTPTEISDILCAEGYSYGDQRVRRMLIQQGAEL